jgi:hypothetical protein
MEAALRFRAHAAQQLSCSSLPPGNGWRSSAFEAITGPAKLCKTRIVLGFGLIHSSAGPSVAHVANCPGGYIRAEPDRTQCPTWPVGGERGPSAFSLQKGSRVSSLGSRSGSGCSAFCSINRSSSSSASRLSPPPPALLAEPQQQAITAHRKMRRRAVWASARADHSNY